MSMNKEYIIKYATKYQPLSKDEYFKNTRNLSPEEIVENFYKPKNEAEEKYYERIIPSTDEEINMALLYTLCEKLDETHKTLKSIKGMVTFFTVIAIIGLIIGFIISL